MILASMILGGLTSSTLLLLFIVPVVYTSFEELKNQILDDIKSAKNYFINIY